MSRVTQLPVSVLIVLALLTSTVACQKASPEAQAGQTSALEVIPWPDLSRAAPRVAEQIEEQRSLVESLERGSPEAAESLGQAGLLLLTYEFFEAAEACFRNASTLEPDDYRWSYLHGYLLSMQGQLEEAVEQLERSLELRPAHRAGRLRLADAHWQRGELESAERVYESVLEESPDSAPALAGVGRIEASRGNHQAAVDAFLRALELEPAANYLHYALSQSYRSLGALDEAEVHLNRRGDIQVPIEDPLINPVQTLGQTPELYLARADQAMKNERYDIAADAYRRALELDAKDYGSYRGLSFCLYELGDHAGARQALETALERATTGDAAEDRSREAELHRLLGEMDVLAGNDEQAQHHFRAAHELDERRADVRELLANALARSGAFEEAADHYDALLRAMKDDVDLLGRRGAVRVNLGDREGALADLERAFELAPDDAAVRQRLIAAYTKFGLQNRIAELRAEQPSSSVHIASIAQARTAIGQEQWQVAVDRLETVLSDPSAEPASKAEAHMLMGSVLGHTGRFDRAVEHFGSVLELLPRNQEAWRGQMTALLLAERYHEARERMRKGLEVFPRDARLAHSLARLLVSSPELSDRNGPLGLELAQRVRSTSPSVEIDQTVAMALAEVGEFGQAAELQARLVAQAPPISKTRLEAYRREQPWVLDSPEEVIGVLRGLDS